MQFETEFIFIMFVYIFISLNEFSISSVLSKTFFFSFWRLLIIEWRRQGVKCHLHRWDQWNRDDGKLCRIIRITKFIYWFSDKLIARNYHLNDSTHSLYFYFFSIILTIISWTIINETHTQFVRMAFRCLFSSSFFFWFLFRISPVWILYNFECYVNGDVFLP